MSTKKSFPQMGSPPFPTSRAASPSSYKPNNNKKKKGQPAAWRCNNDTKVHGLARRKGEMNPMKWGFHIHDDLKDHKRWKDAPDLPARKSPKNKRKGGGGVLGKLKLWGKKKDGGSKSQ
jgi:hypothetical protein